MDAARQRNLEMVKLLLPMLSVSSINMQDYQGKTALHWALNERVGKSQFSAVDLDIVKLLLDARAQLHIEDKSGETAFMHAIIDNFTDTEGKYLLEKHRDCISDQDIETAKKFMGKLLGLDIAVAYCDNCGKKGNVVDLACSHKICPKCLSAWYEFLLLARNNSRLHCPGNSNQVKCNAHIPSEIFEIVAVDAKLVNHYKQLETTVTVCQLKYRLLKAEYATRIRSVVKGHSAEAVINSVVVDFLLGEIQNAVLSVSTQDAEQT